MKKIFSKIKFSRIQYLKSMTNKKNLLSLKSKVLFFLLVVTIIMVVLSALLYSTSQYAIRLLTNSQNLSTQISALKDLEVNFYRSLMPLNDYITTVDKQNYKKYKNISLEVDMGFNILLKSSVNNVKYKTTIIKLKSEYSTIRAYTQQILNSNNPVGNLNIIHKMQQTNQKVQEISSEIQELKLLIESEHKMLNNVFMNKQITSRQSSLVSMLIVIIFIFAAWMVIRKTISNIQVLAKTMKAVEENGDLNVKADIKSHDEIGQLSVNLNNMINKLKSIMTEVKKSSALVAASSQQMSAITQQIASSSENQSDITKETLYSMEQLDGGIQNVSKNIHEIHQNIFDVSKLIKNMEQSLDNVFESIVEVNNQAINTSKATERCTYTLEKSKAGMDNINLSVGSLVLTIKKLGKSSVNIGEIVSIIDNIAEQTNLLALNAAIEAAIAGKYGRGFAVVAEAIGDLAKKSGEATQDITKLIRGIQEEVSEAIETAEKGSIEVEHGVSFANDTEKALELIKAALKTTSVQIKNVTDLSEEQKKAIKEIVHASSNMNDLSLTIAETLEEQSETSSEVVKSVENISQSSAQIATGTNEIASSTEGLAKEAQNLANLVAMFKIS